MTAMELMITPAPAIYKPKMLWTGKQVVSSLLKHMCRPPLPQLNLGEKCSLIPSFLSFLIILYFSLSFIHVSLVQYMASNFCRLFPSFPPFLYPFSISSFLPSPTSLTLLHTSFFFISSNYFFLTLSYPYSTDIF